MVMEIKVAGPKFKAPVVPGVEAKGVQGNIKGNLDLKVMPGVKSIEGTNLQQTEILTADVALANKMDLSSIGSGETAIAAQADKADVIDEAAYKALSTADQKGFQRTEENGVVSYT